MYHCRHQTKGHYTPLAKGEQRSYLYWISSTTSSKPSKPNQGLGWGPELSHEPGFHMGCTVPTPGHMCCTVPTPWTISIIQKYEINSQVMTPDMTQVLQSQPATALPYVGHLGPVRGWLPLASMPLINQRGQYKSDSIIADAVGSTLQCIFNTFYLPNLIIDGKNIKKYQRHICG